MTVLKCQIRSSTRLNNKGKLYTLLTYLYHNPYSTVDFEFVSFQMSKNRIRRKHTADATQLHRRSHLVSHTYKESPLVRGSMQDALEDKDKIQRINHPAKDQHERLPGGVGQTWPARCPGASREESRPRHLITFHMCFWREPTSRAINRASLHPPQHTHTSHSTLSKKALPLLLS